MADRLVVPSPVTLDDIEKKINTAVTAAVTKTWREEIAKAVESAVQSGIRQRVDNWRDSNEIKDAVADAVKNAVEKNRAELARIVDEAMAALIKDPDLPKRVQATMLAQLAQRAGEAFRSTLNAEGAGS